MPPHSLGIARCLGRSATPRSVAIPTTSSRLKPARHLHVLRGVRIQPALAPTPRSIYQAPHELGCRYASTGTPSEAPGNASTKITGGPDITTYYSIFPRTIPAGPPPASPFEISSSDLRQKQHAEALSARINEAYRTLVDPLQRAQYLLREWHGIDVTAEDASTKHALDPETLMEVMEVQETIEEVGAAPEAEAEIEVLKKDNDARIKACVEALGKSFDKGDIEAARKECIRLRFWYSVGEGLREWEPGKTEIRLVHGS
ncbi:hypothetical protein N7470_001337 [Penicillium chermesinum]|nr:hypothetical protein N7470_001337 [Penicillium chermesinum]